MGKTHNLKFLMRVHSNLLTRVAILVFVGMRIIGLVLGFETVFGAAGKGRIWPKFGISVVVLRVFDVK
jgi:hypothetical protein